MTDASAQPAITPPISTHTELSNAQAFAAMLGIALVVILVAFDQTVVGTALPRVVAELHGFALYSWVATAYLLTSAILIPITGRLGDLYGRWRFVLLSIIVFTASSVLCGYAPSMRMLVLARGLQGVGGGMLIGTAWAATSDIFPNQLRRIRWQAMTSAAFGIANATGPTLGGYLTENFGWRSVFFVNLPIGLVALWVVASYLPRIAGHRDPEARLDWPGALLLAVVIGSSLLAIEAAVGQQVLRESGLLRFWLPLAVAIIAVLFFLRVETHTSQPIMPLRLFRVPAVSTLVSISLLNGLAMFAIIFYAPLLLQAGFAVSPHTSGIVMSPLVVCISVGSLINGRLHGRIKAAHRLLSLGCLLFLLGCLGVTFVQPGQSPVWIALAFGFAGAGLGFQMPNLTIQMQAAVERRDIGMASALVQTMRSLGSMCGAAIIGALVGTLYRLRVDSMAADNGTDGLALGKFLGDPQMLIAAADQQKAHTLAESMSAQAPAILDQLINGARLALVHSIHVGLYFAAGLSVITFIFSLRLPPIVRK